MSVELQDLVIDISHATIGGLIHPLVQDLFQETATDELVRMLVAHWAFETGHGKMMHCYNIGNIKSTPKDGFDFVHYPCGETLNGKEHKFSPGVEGYLTVCRFRAYRRLKDGLGDYLKLIHNRFSDAWAAARRGDTRAFVNELFKKKYFTFNEEGYFGRMSGVHAMVAKLVVPPAAANAFDQFPEAKVREPAKVLNLLTSKGNLLTVNLRRLEVVGMCAAASGPDVPLGGWFFEVEGVGNIICGHGRLDADGRGVLPRMPLGEFKLRLDPIAPFQEALAPPAPEPSFTPKPKLAPAPDGAKSLAVGDSPFDDLDTPFQAGKIVRRRRTSWGGVGGFRVRLRAAPDHNWD